MTHRIISRKEWGAKPASLPSTPMSLPASRVFLHHSVTTASSDPLADMRAIEKIGLQRFGQFSYSYNISPHDGEILEGCGLRRGAHTSGRNSTSFGISWIGNYEERAPKVQQLDATRWLISELVNKGHLHPDHAVLGHRDVYATACPGSKLYAMLDDIRTAPVPTPPPSSIVAHTPMELDVNIIPVDVTIPTDAAGSGWTKVAHPINQIIGFLPPGLRPAADGRYLSADVHFAAEEEGTVVSVTEWAPGSTAVVRLRIAS